MQYGLKIIQNWWRKILAIIILILVILLTGAGYIWLVTGRWPDWTGFGTKTLWDLMELLIVPLVLAGGAYLLNESARKREQAAEEQTRQRERGIAEKRAETELNIASDNRQETALQTYLDKMTELLIKENLRESKQESEVIAVARARTLTVLRRLDKDRKGALLRFLYEANLINKDKIVINLSEADLTEADLRRANLSGANLSRANLTEVTYNQNTRWPEGFDPDVAGAICVNEYEIHNAKNEKKNFRNASAQKMSKPTF